MKTRTRNPNTLKIAILPVALLAAITGLIMLLSVGVSNALAGAHASDKDIVDTADGVKVDEATVVKADIVASNGVIHVIDTVIVPN